MVSQPKIHFSFNTYQYYPLAFKIVYLKDDENVLVILKYEKETVIIEVKDNGIGIPEKNLPFILERFYRPDESRNKSTGGSVIGLTIVKSII